MARAKSARQRQVGLHPRRINFRPVRQRFLLVCEGARTEPNYFDRLQNYHHIPVIIKVQGLGTSPQRLVEAAERLSREDDYDQVWCVFDRDAWSADEFNSAILTAKHKKIRVAYSNQAFELWYLLHFNFYNTALTRQEYIGRLSKLLGHPYKKNSWQIYDELAARQETAIANAERLLAQYDHPNPAEDDPSTTVHLLVKELRRFME